MVSGHNPARHIFFFFLKPANCCAPAASAMWKGLDPEMWGGRMGNEMGKEELHSNISCGHSIVCVYVRSLALFKKANSISKSTERDGSSAFRLPACGCASARAEPGWLPIAGLVGPVALGAWAGVGCRDGNAPCPLWSHPSCAVTRADTGECLSTVEVQKRARWLCSGFGCFFWFWFFFF